MCNRFDQKVICATARVAFAFCVVHASKWTSGSYLVEKILHQHPLCSGRLSERCKGSGIGVGDEKKSVKKKAKTGKEGKGEGSVERKTERKAWGYRRSSPAIR